MSIELTDFRAKLNDILDDVVSGTTSESGADNNKNFIDILLAKYPDHYFAGHTAYLPDVPETRDIEDFLQPEGIVMVRNAFTSQVSDKAAYELHKFHPDRKKIAINQALLAAYPYFYKRVEASLPGQGSSDTEYDVPDDDFTDGFPDQIWLKTTSDSKISYKEFFDVDYKEIAGSKKFYADIPTTKTILLIGKTWLSQFAKDDDTTELTDEQADIVCLKAIANLYRMQTGIVNAEDAARFDVLANQKELEFQGLVRLRRMPELYHLALDWGWTE